MAVRKSKKQNIFEVEDRLKNGNKLVFYPNNKIPIQMPVSGDIEEEKNEKKHRWQNKDGNPVVPGVHTMRFRIWIIFLIMTVSILAVTWTVGLIVLPPGASKVTVLLILAAVLLAAGIFVGYFASRFAARPMERLAKELAAKDENGERKPLEPSGFTEIDELKTEFNKAIDDIERNNRFRRDLLANVSHDMKTPLTMIQAYAEMIRDITAGNKEKCSQNASTIIAETTRLNALINEVMELSKLEAGVAEITRRSFDYTEKVNEVIERFVGISEARGYNITADIEKGLVADADPDNIDRVLYNLIGNAINYTGSDKKILVVCRKLDGVIETHIIDTGKGIAKEDLASVWDKYYRLVQDKRRVMGSGLGLSIVKTVLDRHGVEYGVISEVGKGSDFYFCLPAVGARFVNR